jgi:hypothetical protein
VISEIRFYIFDQDAASDVYAHFCWSAADAVAGSDVNGDCPIDEGSSGTPGRTTIVLEPDTQVLYQQDRDSDGTVETIVYYLRVDLPSGTASTSILMARVLWTRTLSNPPAAATFGDVPTTHPFFPFVEALADSGITGGCGGGNYCPNSPLTRGQMAVFLSTALGLNWDYTQTEPNP